MSVLGPSLAAGRLAAAVTELKALLDDRTTTADAVREHHSHGESYHPAAAPDAVCFPRCAEEVAGILRISARYHVPVVPYGAGTSLEGHVNAIRGGISIDMRHMNRIRRVSPEDMDATVEAGVTRSQLNKSLRNTGLTFFIDPGTDCTLGGMAATRASGTTAVRYGTMRDNVLSLTVVLAGGRIIQTGTRARKSSAGYDLTRLFVGSEGTLGVITEITLKLHPVPEAIAAAMCPFATVQGAIDTAIATIQLGVSVARIELLDDTKMDAINRYSRTSYAVSPTLFLEFHGDSEEHVRHQAATVQGLATEHGGHEFRWATKQEERDTLWKARHDALYASLAVRPGAKAWTTDVCVPISRLAECIMETKEDNAGALFPIHLVGHVGDGNFHMAYILDPGNEREVTQAHELNERMILRALEMGGTSTGEHGVGYGKKKYLADEFGPAIDVMRAIKRALDPHNLMNPGKVVDPDESFAALGRED